MSQDGLPKGIKPIKVAKACVIGAGTMGGGITMCFADAGIDVTMVDQSPEAIERMRARARAIGRATYPHYAL